MWAIFLAVDWEITSLSIQKTQKKQVLFYTSLNIVIGPVFLLDPAAWLLHYPRESEKPLVTRPVIGMVLANIGS